MPAIVLLAPEEQQPEQETHVHPDVDPSPPSARPKERRQKGKYQCLYPGCTKSFTGGMVSPGMRGNMKGVYLNVRCA